MDPIEALKQIFQQLNDLSGGGLDLVNQLAGGAEGGGAPENGGGEVPAPPGASE